MRTANEAGLLASLFLSQAFGILRKDERNAALRAFEQESLFLRTPGQRCPGVLVL
jgi:hypothetical protein